MICLFVFSPKYLPNREPFVESEEINEYTRVWHGYLDSTRSSQDKAKNSSCLYAVDHLMGHILSLLRLWTMDIILCHKTTDIFDLLSKIYCNLCLFYMSLCDGALYSFCQSALKNFGICEKCDKGPFK